MLIAVVVFWLLTWRFGTSDGWMNLFNSAAQVVSLFVAVFLVFATVQRPANLNLISMFTRGELDHYHFTDLFLVRLAVCSVFTTLAGTFVAKHNTDTSEPVHASVAGFAFTTTTQFNALLWLIGTLRFSSWWFSLSRCRSIT